MKDPKDVVACVVDHGLFLHIAQKLSEQYRKVYYWTPWESCLPRIEHGIVGDGFDNLHRVSDIWRVKKECDLFVFPDIGFAGMQRELISQGYPVWGHRGGDVLETNRGLFLDTLKECGLPVGKFEVIEGLTKLRDHLRDKTDKWIKVSRWRGDWETLHWRDWEQDEVTLDYYAYKLGPVKEYFKFYVFDPIKTDIEDGIDAYCIGGEYPSLVMHGMERKDKSYLCGVQKFDDVAPEVRVVSEAFAPVLKEYDYRGFFSTEVRIKDGDSYFIDPTCRAASPPSQVMVELFGNLGEIILAGANGQCIEPEPTAKIGGQVLLTVHREKCDWITLDLSKELRRWIKCGFACELDGKLTIPPHPLETMVGWLCATGDSIEEFIDNLKDMADELTDGVECDTDSLAHLLVEAKAAEEKGIEFTEQEIPKPSVVIEA